MRSKTRLALTIVALCAATAPLHGQLLGEITFPNSGAPEAQDAFVEGVLYLHNFEYEDSAEAFRRAQEIDPGFALAYWGEAMTHNHPIWMERDAEAGRAALARLAPTAGERRATAGTEREAAYLEAVEILYAEDGLSKQEQDDRYRDAMRRLYEAYPDDDEAAAFYALSILGTAHEGRDFATYMKAAAVAFEVWERNDRHPGAAHYLIHSFDDPIHAPLGLPMARVYAEIAPAAAHAQHMTSHIFVALGLWQDVVDANVVASRVQNEGLAERGRPPRLCGHYPYWLEYGYLQQGRFADARRVLDACRASVAADDEDYQHWHFAVMRARYLIDTGAWEEADELALEALEGRHAETLLVDGLAAHHRGDRAALAAALDGLRAIDSGDQKELAAILTLELEGLLALADDPEAAVEKLEAAAEAEAARPFAYGPPPIVKPTDELLGEVLLEVGRPADAVDAFRRQLERTPGRTASLLGLARSARATGEHALARATYARLADTWSRAPQDLPVLQEARAGAAPR